MRKGTGLSDARFRDGQEEAIRHVVEGQGRLLLVQRTGWGKSFVYFIATRLLRDQGKGPALLISPLLSLMRNQIAAAERMGVRAFTINSSNIEQWEGVEEELKQDEIDILLISPERLTNERFRDRALTAVGGRVALLVIDEAHCISDWGHDFRPNYRLIERIVRNAPKNLRLLATTATANKRVQKDLRQALGPSLTVQRGDLHRPSLVLQTIRLTTQAERLAWLAEHVAALPGNGIVYVLTKRDAVQVADWLCLHGLEAHAYSSDTVQREELEQALLANEIKVLVATPALGMGFDKPDLAFVIHYQAPGSVVTYYQQVGRAGRALDAAHGVLLSGEEETEITGYFIDSAFPSREEVERVVEALETHPDGLTQPQILAEVNISHQRLKRTLKLLSLESPALVVKQGSKWQLTAADLGEAFWERAERLTRLRREEQRQMQEYVSLESGHMEFLISALDGDPGRVEGPSLPPLPTQADPERVREAEAFLKRTSLPVEPRKQWPPGGLPIYKVKGNIAEERRAQPGKALCVWGDAGWGGLVRRGKYSVGLFADELVAACADLVQQWSPDPVPTWVTCIPSRRHPDLVPDFAQRLANRLGLPFAAVLVRCEDRPEQKKMANSTRQALNLDGALQIEGELPPGPVFLIDDMIDSRWTMTVAAWLIRSKTSDEVWPLALALTGPGR